MVDNSFQSHAGSIEALDVAHAIDLMRRFQSHAGSIEATRPRFQSSSRHTFQSHAGSIEAPDEVLTRDAFQRFNPTLVRLRPPTRC